MTDGQDSKEQTGGNLGPEAEHSLNSIASLEDTLRKNQSELERIRAISKRPGEIAEEMGTGIAPQAEHIAADETRGQAIFIAHNSGKKALDELKRILVQFNIPFIIAPGDNSLKRPISHRVKDSMQECDGAVFIFSAGDEPGEKRGNQGLWRPSDTMLFELGAASYVYRDKIVILQEESLKPVFKFGEIVNIPFTSDRLGDRSLELIKQLLKLGLVKITT